LSKPPVPAPGDNDNDGIPTLFELLLGTNGSLSDTDGDKIGDGVEFIKFASNPTVADTDGDGCPDGKEIASVTGDNDVNVIDLLLVAQHQGSTGGPTYVLAFDINRNGSANVIDLLLVSQNVGDCP
jgi:hypothetical protein